MKMSENRPIDNYFGQDRNGMGAIRSPTTAAEPLNFMPLAAYSSLFPIKTTLSD